MEIQSDEGPDLATRKRRIAVFIIDHFAITFLIVSATFLFLGPDFISNSNPGNFFTTGLMVLVPGFLLYFSKDSVQGISPGKWIMGVMIRDQETPDKVPGFGDLFVRNLFTELST